MKRPPYLNCLKHACLNLRVWRDNLEDEVNEAAVSIEDPDYHELFAEYQLACVICRLVEAQYNNRQAPFDVDDPIILN